jgi:ABC-2 type transport system permease protein
MEEKAQRIAEVMLGSVKPFQFMMGKIIGGVGVSLTAAGVYIVCGIYAVISLGLEEYMPYHVIGWFLLFMALNIFMVGALLAAIGSSCNDAKEAQSVTFPAMIPIIIPMFMMVPVLKEPLSGFATWLSLFPPFTPVLMLLRLSTPASIPIWQPWVGLFGVIIFTIIAIWVGGRIFRVGILLQGQPPKLSNFIRWAIRG